MPVNPVPPLVCVRKEPFELWLGRELARRYRSEEPTPDHLRWLMEKLVESQLRMGCANREASAKIAE